QLDHGAPRRTWSCAVERTLGAGTPRLYEGGLPWSARASATPVQGPQTPRTKRPRRIASFAPVLTSRRAADPPRVFLGVGADGASGPACSATPHFREVA